jgi:Bacterial SCP ortholog
VSSRLRPGRVDEVAAALGRVREERPNPGDLRLLTRHFLALLERDHPGKSVEVRVPPFAAIQCVAGARHTRGKPPAVVETDPETWVRLAAGDLSWPAAVAAGQIRASGERSDLSTLLPILGA